MPKFYVTSHMTCMVGFVKLVEADSPLEAKALVDENNEAGEYIGCSVGRIIGDAHLTVDNDQPEVEFVSYACVAEDLKNAMQAAVDGYDAFTNGETNAVPLSNGVQQCRDVLARCQ